MIRPCLSRATVSQAANLLASPRHGIQHCPRKHMRLSVHNAEAANQSVRSKTSLQHCGSPLPRIALTHTFGIFVKRGDQSHPCDAQVQLWSRRG
jgi:hypothetical protein